MDYYHCHNNFDSARPNHLFLTALSFIYLFELKKSVQPT